MINQMGTAQREAFFAKLLSFTGNDATPSLRSREGSHYEYDSEAEGTVGITEDGRRFLVESAGVRRIANAYCTGVRIF